MNDMFRKKPGHLAKDLDWCTAKSEMDMKKIRQKAMGTNLTL